MVTRAGRGFGSCGKAVPNPSKEASSEDISEEKKKDLTPLYRVPKNLAQDTGWGEEAAYSPEA